MYKHSFPIKVSLSTLSDKVKEVIDNVNASLGQFNQSEKIYLWTTVTCMNVICRNRMSNEQIQMIKKEVGDAYNKTLEGYDHMIGDPEITEV